MSNERIVIVIPCFNHARELGRTLESLTKQTLQPAEIVVVDDGSSDVPSDVVVAFKDKLNIVFLRFDENRGAPAARNKGADVTSAPLIMFLDADIALESDALEAMARQLEENHDADYAYANFYWGKKKFPAKPFDVRTLKERNYIHTSALVRRSAFPGFDENLKKFQDWDLWLTMAENGKNGTWIDRYLFHVMPRKTGISTWLPSFAHKIPWPILGWMPKEIGKYREAEKVIREKHKI